MSLKLSTIAEKILVEEETENARLLNRFRYIALLILAGPMVVVSLQSVNTTGAAFNMIIILLYLAVTLWHSRIIRQGEQAMVARFNLLVACADMLLVIMMIAMWTLMLSPDDFTFAAKTPVWVFIFVVIAATSLQFKTRVVFTVLGIFLAAYTLVIVLVLLQNPQTTGDWNEYVNGPKVDLSDLIIIKPVMAILAALISSFSIRKSLALVARITRAEVKKTLLSRYFSPAVVDDITSGQGEVSAPRRQVVSVLFLDIRNFTAISEKVDAENLVQWLSELRGLLTRQVFRFNGAVDKFIGDAVMATFGTPHPADNPAEDTINAVDCAVEMIRSLDEFNALWQPRGILTEIGIGIHTGEVIAGNIGQSDQIEYTVIGDTVNTASRIESLCKRLERNLLISKEVYQLLNTDRYETEKMPLVHVKGKSQPLELFAVWVN